MVNQRIDGSLTAEQLRSVLDYDPNTGLFTWRYRPDRARNWNTRRANKPAGGLDGQYGYLSIRINNQLYQAHRLAWLYMTGEWPAHLVDHIDMDPINNRWVNLRGATKGENMMNQRAPAHNTSGVKGVTWNAQSNLWQAQIQLHGKNHYLGMFDTIEEAAAVRHAAARRLHGAFSRTT